MGFVWRGQGWLSDRLSTTPQKRVSIFSCHAGEGRHPVMSLDSGPSPE